MSREGLSKKVLKDILIPLPPLAEQHRIIGKVDRLMALCDELEAKQEQERAGCLKLGTASLAELQNAESPEEFERLWAQVCDAFDLILDCPENVDVLRQTILQLAVQGKLGTQDEGDEPASVLLERIKNNKNRLIKDGKIPKDKPKNMMMKIFTTKLSQDIGFLQDLERFLIRSIMVTLHRRMRPINEFDY